MKWYPRFGVAETVVTDMNTDMKKVFLALMIGLMMLGAMAQDGKFTVRGTFKHVGDSVHFLLRDLGVGESRAVTGEMLEVSFDLKDATEITIGRWFKGRGNEEKGDVTFPAIPGETLVVTADENGDLHLSGSQFYVDYNEARKAVDPVNKEGDAFMKELMDKMAAGVPEAQLMELYQAKVPVLLENLNNAVMGYVKAHPDQDAAAALIAELPEELDLLEPAEALLTDRARGSVAANLYKKKLEKAQNEAAKHAKKGSEATDFTLMDINGKPLSLSSLRGKWVVIDFWGSWCVWCIKGMPKMKEYYAKYQDKLEILGVDCNDTVEKWKGAVAKHELPWLHVYWDKEKGDNPLELYHVDNFPTKIIIDPEGKVAKVVVGESPGFYDFLDKVLQ